MPAASMKAWSRGVGWRGDRSCIMCSCLLSEAWARTTSRCSRHCGSSSTSCPATSARPGNLLQSKRLPAFWPLAAEVAGRMPSAGLCKGCTLGLATDYKFGGPGTPVVSKATRAHPKLVQVLCRGCRAACPDFKFTSIQVGGF